MRSDLMIRWGGLLISLATVVAAAGCTTKVTGVALAAHQVVDTGGPAAPTVRGTTPSTRQGADSPMARVSPCSLLSDVDKAELGLTVVPKELEQGYGRKCQFSERGFLVSVTIFDALGLDTETPGAVDKKTLPPVGRHQALQYLFGSSCAISIEVTKTSMVQIGSSISGSTDQQKCALTLRAARLVEPKMP